MLCAIHLFHSFATMSCAWTLLLLLLTPAVLHAQTTGTRPTGSECVSPDSLKGVCVLLTQCPRMMNLLKQKPLSRETRIFLLKSQCSFEGRVPVICCPGSTPSTNLEVVTTANFNPNNPNSGGQTAGGAGADHPNRRLLPANCGVDLSNKVIGGDVTDILEFPWLVGLEYSTFQGRFVSCGGALINSKYVLTAAHCLARIRNARLVGVRLGEYNTDTDPDCIGSGVDRVCNPPLINIPMETITIHPGYSGNDPNKQNDIGLIRLSQDVQFRPHISPICLPEGQMVRSNFLGNNHTVAGWGQTEDASRSSVKMKIGVPVINNAMCSKFHGSGVQLSETQMCAGGMAGKDSCRGDSGGPLMMVQDKRWYVSGIVSIGPFPCGQRDKPGIYTRINSFLPWILDNIRP